MMNKKIGNYLFPSSDTHFERWILDGEYQAKQRDAIFQFMEGKREIEYIVDVGGHVGLWSRPMMHRANTKYIWAFEPNQAVRECYVLNMGGFDNYSVYPFALGHKNTTGHLNIENDNELCAFTEEYQDGFKAISILIDSGASDSVAPPGTFPDVKVLEITCFEKPDPNRG